MATDPLAALGLAAMRLRRRQPDHGEGQPWTPEHVVWVEQRYAQLRELVESGSADDMQTRRLQGINCIFAKARARRAAALG